MPLASACSSGPEVDASCDVDGITHEVEHIVEESQLEVASLDTLICADAWVYVEATLAGSDGEQPTPPLLFLRDGDSWILKAPESACDSASPSPPLPEEIRARACV